jgi:hypothetical protein
MKCPALIDHFIQGTGQKRSQYQKNRNNNQKLNQGESSIFMNQSSISAK